MFAWAKTALEENSTFVQHNFSYYYIFYAIKNNNKKILIWQIIFLV